VIELFPQDRHFIPSILFILWGEAEAEALPGDLLRMVSTFHTLNFFDHAHAKQVGDYATKGVISSQATFSLSSKTTDLDEKFTEILGSMDLDTAGGLVEVLSRQGQRTNGLGNGSERSCFFLRVPAGGHFTLEGLCLGLGSEMFH
jgi:hypothetical protein